MHFSSSEVLVKFIPLLLLPLYNNELSPLNEGRKNNKPERGNQRTVPLYTVDNWNIWECKLRFHAWVW